MPEAPEILELLRDEQRLENEIAEANEAVAAAQAELDALPPADEAQPNPFHRSGTLNSFEAIAALDQQTYENLESLEENLLGRISQAKEWEKHQADLRARRDAQQREQERAASYAADPEEAVRNDRAATLRQPRGRWHQISEPERRRECEELGLDYDEMSAQHARDWPTPRT